ncbi:MAG: hypothetical protein IJ791_03720 [Lachnospiraceae bacterium]|nr:hypothetical protein [Lachnospiraceae bacterium]
MEKKIILEKQDMRYLEWSHTRSSSGTAGTFLKSEEMIDGKKRYYKLSNYDPVRGIIGHECINEIIVDRLLTILGVEHLEYQLIHAEVEVGGKTFETWLCASDDFKEKGDTKLALDAFYQSQVENGESPYEFCKKQGWQKYIDTMLVVDYLIQNRDRHGANIEVLRNGKNMRIAPLFDHGLSFLCSCYSEEEIKEFDVAKDRICQNFIGSRSTLENLALVHNKKSVFIGTLKPKDKEKIFEDLEEIIPPIHRDKIWEMLYQRWLHYESLCNQ